MCRTVWCGVERCRVHPGWAGTATAAREARTLDRLVPRWFLLLGRPSRPASVMPDRRGLNSPED